LFDSLVNCVNDAINRGAMIPADNTSPTGQRAHCFVSCQINLCFFNLLPELTIAGGISVEVAHWMPDSWSDIFHDLNGIAVSYNPSRSCAQDCGICP
jgi:hypothetical protein